MAIAAFFGATLALGPPSPHCTGWSRALRYRCATLDWRRSFVAERAERLLRSTLPANSPQQSMGYLNDFGERLAEKLSALPEDVRDEIVAFVKAEVLASYKNGLRDAGQKRKDAPPRRRRA